MENIDFHEMAERYLLGNVSSEEKEWIETEMKHNPELRKEVDLLKGISYAIQDQDLLDFRAMVQEEAAEYKVSRKGQQLRRIYVRASAAAASIILIAATFFMLSVHGHKSASSVQVFAQFYQPYQSGLMFRSGSDNDDVIYGRAIRQYITMNYKMASAAFDSVLFKDPGHNAALFYSGLSYMEQKDFQLASKRFEKIIINANSLYVDQAEWYGGLALLAINDRKSAVHHFKNLASRNGFYRSKAALVLSELKGN